MAATEALLHIWCEDSFQFKLKAISKNRKVYESNASRLTDMGYEKKTKIKKLTAKYQKVKDGNRKSGNILDASFCLF